MAMHVCVYYLSIIEREIVTVFFIVFVGMCSRLFTRMCIYEHVPVRSDILVCVCWLCVCVHSCLFD